MDTPDPDSFSPTDFDASTFQGPDFQAIVLLADSAQVADGKLYILGGGLSVIGPRPQATAIALRLAVPWDQANVKHDWRLELTDQDGRQVSINDKPVSVAGQFEAGRPAGVAPGTQLWVPLAINFGAMPLAAGQRFTWRLFVNDATSEGWSATVTVRGPG